MCETAAKLINTVTASVAETERKDQQHATPKLPFSLPNNSALCLPVPQRRYLYNPLYLSLGTSQHAPSNSQSHALNAFEKALRERDDRRGAGGCGPAACRPD